MENEKILKRHEDRKDLAGEHAFGDVGPPFLNSCPKSGFELHYMV
jgi:hypothetical protein